MITIGPVIGLVTPTTARVLFETSIDLDELQISLAPVKSQTAPVKLAVDDGSGLISTTSNQEPCSDENCDSFHVPESSNSILKTVQRVKANRAIAVQFDALLPDTNYTFCFCDARIDFSDVPESVFRTPSDNDVNKHIAFVSCNYPERMGKKNLWKDLADRACFIVGQDQRIELIIHGGDQIYSDDGHDAYPNCLQRIEEKGLSHICQDDLEYMLEEYRKMYRSVWSMEHQKRAMANASNIMICDDHDYFDDAGSLEPHWNPHSKEHLIARIARQVYWEYQRQLLEDIPFDDSTRMQEHFWKRSEGYSQNIHPRIGLLMLDLRAGRMFDRSTEEPFLGKSQWQDIENEFKNEFWRKDVLLVVTPVPFVFLGPNTCDFWVRVSDYLNDLMDQWAYREHREEQRRFLNLLKQWKEQKKGREVLIVAGDAHFGFESKVLNSDGSLFCRQFTSSGITNAPPPYLATSGIYYLSRFEDTVNEDYKFTHTSWITTQNYGIISLDHLDAEQPTCSVKHIV